MIDWSVLTSAGFWLAGYPGRMTQPLAIGLLVLFAVCLVAAVVLSMVRELAHTSSAFKRLFKRLQTFFTTLGLVGFVILFFFWQQVPYLSSRFWLLVWLVVGLVWLGFIGRWGFIELPRSRAEAAARREREQYLPKRKK